MVGLRRTDPFDEDPLSAKVDAVRQRILNVADAAGWPCTTKTSIPSSPPLRAFSLGPIEGASPRVHAKPIELLLLSDGDFWLGRIDGRRCGTGDKYPALDRLGGADLLSRLTELLARVERAATDDPRIVRLFRLFRRAARIGPGTA